LERPAEATASEVLVRAEYLRADHQADHPEIPDEEEPELAEAADRL
jgi:hypothetical protein